MAPSDPNGVPMCGCETPDPCLPSIPVRPGGRRQVEPRSRKQDSAGKTRWLVLSVGRHNEQKGNSQKVRRDYDSRIITQTHARTLPTEHAASDLVEAESGACEEVYHVIASNHYTEQITQIVRGRGGAIGDLGNAGYHADRRTGSVT